MKVRNLSPIAISVDVGISNIGDVWLDTGTVRPSVVKTFAVVGLPCG